MNNYRENCVYYDCAHEQGFDVISCNLYDRYGYCPCDGCNQFVNKYQKVSPVKHSLISIHDDESAVCSICFKVISKLSVNIKDFNYCPFCGAKFEGFCHFSEGEDSKHE